MDRRLALLTVGGLGFCRVGPGTVGSLVPVALALGLVAVVGPHWTVDAGLVLLAVAASIACVRFGAEGERLLGRSDPGSIVVDEVAGQALTLLALPWPAIEDGASAGRALAVAAIAFASFRAFDILKPWPIRRLQRVHGGWGILIDDLAAALPAWLAAQALVRMLVSPA